MLKPAAIVLSVLAILCLPQGAAYAQGPVQDALKGCSKQIKTYCSAVKPGDGRLVSCARAHEDDMSSDCIYAINRAGFWVRYLASTLQYVATQCLEDAVNFCPDVKLGEKRVLNCLAANRTKRNKYCGLALSDIGK